MEMAISFKLVLTTLFVIFFAVYWKYNRHESLCGPIAALLVSITIAIEAVTVATEGHYIATVILAMSALVIFSEAVGDIRKKVRIARYRKR